MLKDQDMGSKLYHVLLLFALTCSPQSTYDLDIDPVPASDNQFDWELQKTMRSEKVPQCKKIKPTARDIIRRIYAILPYFDREHQNTLFLQKYRVTVNMMSEAANALDREAAFYAAVLTPILFLHNYRDTWCLLERFQHSLRSYQTASPSGKRTALKQLQNLRGLNSKIRMFIGSLPDQKPVTRTPAVIEMKDDDIRDKKDIRFLKELIKNLG